MSSALQALQIATSSVAEAVWCGSGVIVDGKTEWSGAEVADGLVWIAACGGCHRYEYANVLLAANKDPALSSALQALQIATSSAAEAVWCASGVIADGKAGVLPDALQRQKKEGRFENHPH